MSITKIVLISKLTKYYRNTNKDLDMINIFIDNINEYFNKNIPHLSPDTNYVNNFVLNTVNVLTNNEMSELITMLY